MASRHERWVADLLSGLSMTEMNQLQDLLLKARESVSDA
jgi:hypothetical protein